MPVAMSVTIKTTNALGGSLDRLSGDQHRLASTPEKFRSTLPFSNVDPYDPDERQRKQEEELAAIQFQMFRCV
jgi:hypothetical protein